MIKQENINYLINTLNIDVKKYTKEELNEILDNIIYILKNKINKKKKNIMNMEIEIMNLETSKNIE